MPTFSVDQVVEQGSLDNFGRWAEADEVYRVPDTHNIIVVRNQNDLIGMLGSRYCKGAYLIWSRREAVNFDFDSLYEKKTKTYYGMTEQEVRAQAIKESIPAQKIVRIEATNPPQEHVLEATGQSEEAAISSARKRLPAEAYDIQLPRIIKRGDSGVMEIEAKSQGDAETELRSNHQGALIRQVEEINAPKKGFLSKGRPGKWSIQWYIPYKVQITFTLGAEMTLIYR